MSLVVKRLKAYVKIVILIGLALVVSMVVWKNRQNQVTFWFFHTYEQINVLWLILCTSVGAVFTWWIVTASLGVWRDLRVVHRADEMRRRDQEQKRLAGKLAETEKRLDQQLRKTQDNEESSDETK